MNAQWHNLMTNGLLETQYGRSLPRITPSTEHTAAKTVNPSIYDYKQVKDEDELFSLGMEKLDRLCGKEWRRAFRIN